MLEAQYYCQHCVVIACSHHLRCNSSVLIMYVHTYVDTNEMLKLICTYSAIKRNQAESYPGQADCQACRMPMLPGNLNGTSVVSF